MEDRFEDLRRVIYATAEEFSRFRQLIVNAVMATDIMDKELGSLRKSRWEKAFSERVCEGEVQDTENVNRKATIVIEHLIQASDVAHTMQHWEIYRVSQCQITLHMHVRRIHHHLTQCHVEFFQEMEFAVLRGIVQGVHRWKG
jgi:3'5'-cyclic nucleotide phosphodiesterase